MCHHTVQAIDQRYLQICEIARTRAVISVGISCFIEAASADGATSSYEVYTFNLATLPTQNYVCEPSAAVFLAEHGFDFNAQIRHGLRYTPGLCDEKREAKKLTEPLVEIFAAVLNRRLVLHNGLFDLCFLYNAFYAPLPSKLDTFTADLAEMCVGGVFDTKYVSEKGETPFSATFLEYLFRKLERTHRETNVQLIFPPLLDDDMVRIAQPAVTEAVEDPPRLSEGEIELCKAFKSHGACRKGAACPHSHSIDDIIDAEEAKAGRKRKRGVDSDGPPVNAEMRDNKRLAVSGARSQGHRAGFDAYMTAFCYAAFNAQLGSTAVNGLTQRIHLSNCQHPLLLQKSQFAHTSGPHKANVSRRCRVE